eukprot:Nk52_evm11s48 gene=Nk52_evmTU11s48
MKLSCISFCLIAALLVVLKTVQCSAEESSNLQNPLLPNPFLALLQEKTHERRALANPLKNLHSSDVFLGVDSLSKFIMTIKHAIERKEFSPAILITLSSMVIPILYFISLAFKTGKVFHPVHTFFTDTLAIKNSSIAYSSAAGLWIVLLSIWDFSSVGAMGIGVALVFFAPLILSLVRAHSNFGLDDWIVEMIAFGLSSVVNCLSDQIIAILSALPRDKESWKRLLPATHILIAAGFSALYAVITLVGHFLFHPIANFQARYNLEYPNAVAIVKSGIALVYDVMNAQYSRLYREDAEAIPTILVQALSYTKVGTGLGNVAKKN